ncbi:MAG: ATP-binding protein [Gemmatimonadota bacterium]
MSESANGIQLVAGIARLLNSGLRAEETLASVTERLRAGLGVRSVAIWLREPNSTTLRAISSPALARERTSASFALLPEPDEDMRRLPLLHEGERLGILELAPREGTGPASATEILPLVADILAPFLASIELSEDLAYEVALRSREIEEQRRFITLVVDCLPVGLYVVDREYRIQIWNRKRETGTQGLRRDEVVGRPVFEVLTRQPADQLRAEFDQVFESGEIRQMGIDVTVGGEQRYFRISKIPMRQDGDAITHVITIGEDVTEAHLVQQRILQSEKLAAIGQLAAGVMHEINNPLATIGACVAALENRLEDDVPEHARGSMREYLDIIDKEVQRCTGIVDGLLDFSRPKGKSKRAVAVNNLLEDTLFLLKHHQRFKRLDVRRELAPSLRNVMGNAEQLIQVFMALMLNALDALDQGGALTVRTLTSRGREDEIVVEIEDTGVGIPRTELGKIFEPFYTTKPPGRGTGLGLSVCYGIIEDHLGRIEVDSQPGRGSTFRVYLPVESATRLSSASKTIA